MEHPELWESFGRAGRKKAETQYDNKVLMGRQVEIYNSLIFGSKGKPMIVSRN